MPVDVEVPISVGELFDKISILEIKSERITQAGRLANVRRELALLRAVRDGHAALGTAEMQALAAELKIINQKIWDAEDALHAPEAADYDHEQFALHARKAFSQNDQRAHVKRRINTLAGSALAEEKSYPNFE